VKKHTGLWILPVLSIAAGLACCYYLGNQVKAKKKEPDRDAETRAGFQAEVKTNSGIQSATDNEIYIYNGLTRKIHRSNCPNRPDEKNQVYFDSKTAALTAGYTPCRVCKP
jgi:hypothetical protein